MHSWCNRESEKSIKDYMETDIAVVRKRVQDADTAIMQELNILSTAENVGATTSKPGTMFEEVLNAIRVTLRDCESSDDK